MGLRLRLLKQNMLVLAVTVLITACAALLYGYFYASVYRLPVRGGVVDNHTVIVRDGGILYESMPFGAGRVREMLMVLDMGERYYELDGERYTLRREEITAATGERFILLTVSPLLNLESFYKNLIVFVMVAFFIVFAAVSCIAQWYNNRDIIRPIVRLKREADKLAAGELDTAIADEGEDEVRDLCRSVEQLRIRLKESVYYREKSDDNRKFLVSSISHDLKTPVTAIRGYVEGVLDGVAATGEKKEQYLRAAVSKAVSLCSYGNSIKLNICCLGV